jgi:hypothetical protein
VTNIDTDHGTIDLAETKAAAVLVFDRLERDKDGTLDARELRGRLSAKELAVAEPDHDGTMTKDEYLAVVEQRFKPANADADDTIDARESGSKAGRAAGEVAGSASDCSWPFGAFADPSMPWRTLSRAKPPRECGSACLSSRKRGIDRLRRRPCLMLRFRPKLPLQ